VVSQSAPTVIFLNGIMSGIESWNPQAKAAHAAGFNVLRYEYRGQWRSSGTDARFTMADHREDLQALMDALGIARAHLVGTSYGGMVSMPFAAANPERALSLMPIATTACIRPPSYTIVREWRDLAEQDDVERLFRGMIANLFSPRALREKPELVGRRLDGLKKALQELPEFCRGQMMLHDASFEEMLGQGVTAQLAQVRCKTLVVSGELDLLYPPLDSAHIARHIPGAEHVIVAEAGHAAVAERPGIINTLMLGHLASSG
jgi:pimeloyl-ACP methyl ester carboxylesterase